jgi:hypothetical protein
MTMADDESMYKFYADPDNRAPAGPARRRAAQPLTTHVPIRFSTEVIAEVKQLADKDSKTVSSWIRDVVVEEVARRRPRVPQSLGLVSAPSMNWTVSSSGDVTGTSEPSTMVLAAR